VPCGTTIEVSTSACGFIWSRQAAARAAQPDTLGDTADRLASSAAQLPQAFEGVLFANELLDAFPVHQVVMRKEGLREVYIAEHAGSLVTTEGPPSTPALEDYLARLGMLPGAPGVQAALESGWRVEINLAAVDWIREASRRLQRGSSS
jgi:SAM-dependent MidA family methyltransferase